MDKSGKNTPTITVGVLILIAALSFCAVFLIPWLWSTKNLAERVWRVSLVTSAVILLVSRFGIWVWPINPSPLAASPPLESTEYVKPPD
jgi:uncharacterized membrane protein YbhN (UPF0104 family)